MICMTNLVPSSFPYFRAKRKKNVSMVFFSHSFLNESKQKENLEKKYKEIRLIESFTTDNLSIRIHLYSMTPSLKRENFFFDGCWRIVLVKKNFCCDFKGLNLEKYWLDYNMVLILSHQFTHWEELFEDRCSGDFLKVGEQNC